MLHISENHSLLPHNTFHLEAMTRYFIEYSSEEELREVLKSTITTNHRILQIGSGSNILFTKDFDGVVLHSSISGIAKVSEEDHSVLLKVGAGVNWDDFVAFCVASNWYGAENLSLIPGEVGAAAVQNIGAYGVELMGIVESIEAIEVATGSKRVFKNSDCNYAYRESVFKKELKDQFIITYVVFRLSKTPSFVLDYGNLKESLSDCAVVDLKSVRETIISIRESKLPDPKEIGNAGSFFMNPYLALSDYLLLKQSYPTMPHYVVSDNVVKVPAAWLIEQCGWKGKQIGNAGVHDRQCLVLINKGNATADEISELSAQIITSVKDKFNVELIPEVLFI